MERITINEIEAKFGKPNADGQCTPFWAVKLTDGRKATIWDALIAQTVNMNKVPLTCDVEVKTSPQGYMNIRALGIASGVPEVAEAIGTGKAVIAAKTAPNQAPNPQRVGLFIKLAVEMAVANPMEGKTTEENLCENIQEIKKLEEFTIGLLG